MYRFLKTFLSSFVSPVVYLPVLLPGIIAQFPLLVIKFLSLGYGTNIHVFVCVYNIVGL